MSQRTTAVALAVDNSQFDGYTPEFTGMVSVWPSTRSGLSMDTKVCPRLVRTGMAAGLISALDGLNSRLLDNDTITESCVKRTDN